MKTCYWAACNKKGTFGAWTKAGFSFQALKHTACLDLHSFTYRTCQHGPSSSTCNANSTYLLTCDFVFGFLYLCICACKIFKFVFVCLYLNCCICVVVFVYIRIYVFVYLCLHICRYYTLSAKQILKLIDQLISLVCDQFMYWAWNLSMHACF